METVEGLIEALEIQVGVGSRIKPAQLGLGSPCQGWSVRDVIGHSIGVTLKFADFAAGRTDRPHAPAGDLVGGDHRARLREAAIIARVAWAEADMTRRCHLSFGTVSADVAAGINLFDVIAHTWDIGSATGVGIDCADELWREGLDAALVVIGPDRDPSQYGPEILSSDQGTPRDRFLNYLGRALPSAGP